MGTQNMQKIIGTLVPISALLSLKHEKNDKGTFSAGLIFLDWLKKTHQSAWQLLPLHQTQLELGSGRKHVPSPYKSYGIGLDPKYLPDSFISHNPTETEKENFILESNEWIQDYALFCALTDHFQTDDWRKWDEDLRNRDKTALERWSAQLSKEIDHHIILQWQLHEAYTLLRKKAGLLNITLIGDLPFYLSIQSPLVWAHQEVFQIANDGSMQFVSGTPDSPAAHFGRQVWGHPLYNWKNREKVIAFWKMRLRYKAKLFNQIRFDHAKAIFTYGVMSIENEQYDRFDEGPGAEIFKELINFSRQNYLSIFAEDSGENMKELRKTLQILKIPGIKIFRFALMEKTDKLNSEYADIGNYPENTVAYTTTHDTETLLGYINILTKEQKQRLATTANIAYDPENMIFAKILRDGVLKSPARTVIIPIQDWLLTTDRINIPGTELPIADPNWNFHLNIPIEELPTKF